jgi:hypothetical protein
MVIAGISHEELRHTHAAQEWFAEGRQERRHEGEAARPSPAQPPLLPPEQQLSRLSP